MLNPKTVVLLALALTNSLGGAIAQYFYQRHVQPPAALTATSVLTCALLIFIWYRFDSEQQSYKRTYLLNIGVVGMALIALPYYFFRSRGAKGGFIALLLCILFLIGMFLLSWATRYLVFFATKGFH